MKYAKPWLSVEDQIESLARRGLKVGDRREAGELLREVGYYRLTGYLYPFRESEDDVDDRGRDRRRILSTFRPGSCIRDAADLLNFGRRLRLLVLEAVERIEIALRMRLGHSLGRTSAFAHEDISSFVPSFTETRTGEGGEVLSSPHDAWLLRVRERQSNSDEAFVTHFRVTYDDRMPIWAVTEILELGQVSQLYGGLRNDIATEIAVALGVPTKRLMQSWIATLNYVRNVAAHHARLFNRKLVIAPKRPKGDVVPLLAHLSHEDAPKQLGSYNALAVMAQLLDVVRPGREWALRMAALLRSFPATEHLSVYSMGVADGWLDQELWQGPR